MLTITVTDVKNFMYCPRVVYYHYFLPTRPTTYKMVEGKLEEARVEALEERRSLRAYGLKEGAREFDVTLISERLGVSGLLDLAIVREHEVIPVEFKNSTHAPGLHHKYQVTTYALLCEEKYSKPSRRGFVYLIPSKRVVEIAVTPDTRRFALRTIDKIRAMIESERMPPPTARRERCRDCEFRRLCWDRE
jgi:CRISPR-associated exonuclease Cas4